MKLKMSKFFKILIINLILLEFISFLLIFFSLIPNGVSLMTSVVGSKEFSLQHIPNRNYNFAYKCWESNVFYNEKGNRKYSNNPKAFKIALLGDSVIENAQLSDEEDIGSLLQKKLGDEFEVTNFGILSTGIYDHFQIYKKKISKNYDFLIYFSDPTDIEDNHISRNRPNQNMFKLKDNKIYKVPYDEIFWDDYLSNFNQIKREYFFYIKKYSYTYKVYFSIKEKILNSKVTVIDDNENFDKQIKNLKEPMIIYEHFAQKFINELNNDNLNYFIVPTLKPSLFEGSKYEMFKYDFIKDVWGIDEQSNQLDPYVSAIKFMKKREIFNFPYLSWKCDKHYAHRGAEILSTYVYKNLKKFDDFK